MYYLLSSTTKDPCSPDKPFYGEARRTWLCTGCAAPKPDAKEIDATIQNESLENTGLNGISGCGIGVAHKDLLFALGEDVVRECLYIGRLFSKSGRLMKNWITFNGKQKILVRGSKMVSYRKCSDCGRYAYFSMDPHYLYPQPPTGFSIFDMVNGGLVVTEDLAQKITINRWRKFSCDKLAVLDKPLDGIEELTLPY